MGGKDEAPKGPDFNKLIEESMKFVSENQDLFAEAMKFGKDQFSKGDEWVQRLNDFGMDAMGKLNAEADKFGKDVAGRVAGLDTAGKAWGKAAGDIYGANKKLASDVTGKLMPGMGKAAGVGVDMLEDYGEKGIAEQGRIRDKFANYDTVARQEEQAAQGVGDYRLAADAAEEDLQRRLISFGIDPSQVAGAATSRQSRNQRAVAEAQIMNQQRQDVRDRGMEYSGIASQMWDASREGGLGAIESAGSTGRTIAEIARQPGADYMQQLAALGQYGIGVGNLEQAGGRAGYEMRSGAAGFGERGTAAGAAQHNTNANYGSNLYDQGARGVAQGADITRGAYGTGGQLHQGDVARVEANNKNSFWGGIGSLAGTAAPFVMDAFAPGSGTAARAAMGAAGAAGGGAPSSGTGFLQNIYDRLSFGEGGTVPKEASPSFGILPDDAPIRVTPGERVVDKGTADWFGEKFFVDLQAKARKGRGIPESAAA